MLFLYRQTYPSVALILVSDAYTLIVSGSTSGTGSGTKAGSSPQVEIRLEPIASFDVFGCTLLGRVYGCLGLVQLSGDIFLAVASQAVPLTSRYSDPARPDEVCRITAVDFFAVSSASWDQHGSSGGGAGEHEGSGASTPTSLASAMGGNPDAYAHDGYGQASGVGGGTGQVLEHPASALRKILSNGHFYFSSPSSAATGTPAGGIPFDVSTRLEERLLRATASATTGDASAAPENVAYDPRFVWNGFLLESLLTFRTNLSSTERSAFDGSGFITAVIQGYYGLHDFTLSGNPVTLTLISRLGFARAGTRFNTRGIDDDGHVANFVETETVFRTKDSVFSFVQIRGSVPLFWEQQGTTPFGGQRLQVTRPSVSSQPAFNKHFRALLESYPAVQALNLLSQKEHESLLSVTYREHVRNFNAQMSGQAATTTSIGEPDEDAEGREREIGYTEFDFHNKARVAGGIESVRELIRRDPETGGKVERFGYCVAAVQSGDSGSSANGVSKSGGAKETILSRQEGVFRTNCLDCLDRTNVVQDILSRLAIETYLMHNFPAWRNSDILLGFHRTLWAENGDALSHMYAGTGALNTSFTRSGKRTLAGALSDATKSVSRMYISNFVDKGKQQAIDALLGNLTNQQKVVVVDPVRDNVDSALAHRASEYTSKRQYTIFCGTFNVNGKTPGNESLLSWLFPDPKAELDIIALGFQELVELSPQQIMATDPAKLRQWQTYLLNALSERGSIHDYVLLRAEQLVGTALILLVKTSVAPHVRNVEAAAKKTGLKGMAGNKGAVAVRLELDDSEFCFVTAHFAAGHSNFEQRNMDYDTIASGLQFRRGRKMAAHENILYFGDLNYRIQLPNEEARSLAQQDACSKLVAADQLSTCMRENRVFAGFSEGPLVFRPTYKYDNGSDVYDSSEKQRIPSWTDRILYRGAGLDLLRYNRAELMLSDHRPVYGIFKADVKVIDHVKKEAIARELLASLSPGKVRSETATRKALHKLLDDDAGKQDDSAREPESTSVDIDPNWWQKVDYAQIAQSTKQARPQQARQTSNPFRAGSDVSSPSRKSTGDSLQQPRRPIPPAQLPPRPTSASSQRSRASSLNRPLSAGTAGVSLPPRSLPDGTTVKRKAVPPIVPGNKPQLPSRTASQSSLGAPPGSPRSPGVSNGSAAPTVSSMLRPAARPELNRKASASSPLDEDDKEGTSQTVLRPSTRREATTERQVSAPDPMRGR